MPFDGIHKTTDVQAIHWLPVTRNGGSNIWGMPMTDGVPKQLTNLTSDQIESCDLSRDGKPTRFSRGATTKGVVLIRGFKK